MTSVAVDVILSRRRSEVAGADRLRRELDGHMPAGERL